MAEIEAKFLWQQVVFGIHYLHQRNVTHRDIKLENILLDETRTRVKLIDFGTNLERRKSSCRQGESSISWSFQNKSRRRWDKVPHPSEPIFE